MCSKEKRINIMLIVCARDTHCYSNFLARPPCIVRGITDLATRIIHFLLNTPIISRPSLTSEGAGFPKYTLSKLSPSRESYNSGETLYGGPPSLSPSMGNIRVRRSPIIIRACSSAILLKYVLSIRRILTIFLDNLGVALSPRFAQRMRQCA